MSGAHRSDSLNPAPRAADQTGVNWLGDHRSVAVAPVSSTDAPAPLGETLVERGLITRGDLEMALELQRKTGRRFGATLVDLEILSWPDLLHVLAERLGVTFVDLDTVSVDTIVAQSIPEDVARRYQVLPIARRGREIVVVMKEPSDVFAIDDLRLLLRAEIVPALGVPDQVRTAIDRIWGNATVGGATEEVETEFDDVAEVSDLLAVAEGAPIVRMVNSIIARAVAERASDVHLEPTRDRLRVRYRVDGVLKDASVAPLAMHRATISRLKIMAGMDIAKTRLPQDGRFSAALNERNVDVRVATLPTELGEAAILRLLDKSDGLMELETLGFGAAELERYRAAYSMPQGAVITSGPTGSGKTSTLYATLLEINRPDRSIIAVEDPVEYRVDGIKQMQVATRAGLSFPTALRSILRSDPDVILVGEIRDAETARLAAEASLTGHLVFSTIHTTSAAAVPLRLIDMGVEAFLVTSALTAVVGQRLLRRLCPDCAEVDVPDRQTRVDLDLPDDLMDGTMIRRAVGCPRCMHSGYRGRTGIYEVMSMTSRVCGLVKSGADRREIERVAVDEGMETLRTAALHHVAQGTVDLQELVRVGVC
jgi:type IV pilus assembly protein PilB